jgi:hypothetical protein
MMRRAVDVLMAAGFSDAHDVMQFLGLACAARHPSRQLGGAPVVLLDDNGRPGSSRLPTEAKSVVLYSTPMTGNGPELTGSGRNRRRANSPVAQRRTGNNRSCPDLWVGSPLVAGSSPARPTSEPIFQDHAGRVTVYSPLLATVRSRRSATRV